MAIGGIHNLFIDENNELIVSGDNKFHYQCGMSSDKHHIAPILQPFFNENNIKIKFIYGGGSHSLCIDMDCNVWTFGNNRNGQCGKKIIKKEKNVCYPQKVIDNKVLNGSCGGSHTLLLTMDHKIMVFGDNKNNQCTSKSFDFIDTPQILSKSMELKIDESSYIERLIGLTYSSIIIVNPYKIYKQIATEFI